MMSRIFSVLHHRYHLGDNNNNIFFLFFHLISRALTDKIKRDGSNFWELFYSFHRKKFQNFSQNIKKIHVMMSPFQHITIPTKL